MKKYITLYYSLIRNIGTEKIPQLYLEYDLEDGTIKKVDFTDTKDTSTMYSWLRNSANVSEIKNNLKLVRTELFDNRGSRSFAQFLMNIPYVQHIDLSEFNTYGIVAFPVFLMNCPSLKTVDLSGEFGSDTDSETGYVQKISDLTMFASGCSSLEEIDFSNMDLSEIGSNGYGVLDGCFNVKNAYARNQEDADLLNMIGGNPEGVEFVVKP